MADKNYPKDKIFEKLDERIKNYIKLFEKEFKRTPTACEVVEEEKRFEKEK